MSIPTLSLKGQVAIVTGSRGGLGKAIALTFAEAGADVAVCDIVADDGEMENVVQQIKNFGQRSIAVQTDHTKKSEVDYLTRKVEDELGPIDILVNNAGGGVDRFGHPFFLDVSEDDWDAYFAINFKGCFLCTQAVSKQMLKRRKGNIINISSIGALRGPLNAYNCAKASMERLTKGAALDLAKYNIRVNAIEPGWIISDRVKMSADYTERLKGFIDLTPLGWVGEQEDVGVCALFLASDASRYITGVTIRMDGAYTLAFMEHVDYIHR